MLSAAIPNYSPGNYFDIGQLDAGTSPVLAENSGIDSSTRNPSVIWMHSDNNPTNPNRNVYAMRKSDNKVVRKYNLVGADTRWWEELTIGPGTVAGESYIYVCGIGCNPHNRDYIEIFRFIEPIVSTSEINSAPHYSYTTDVTGWVRFELGYPDGGHDAEGAAIDPVTGDLFVFSKFPANPVKVYKATKAQIENAINSGTRPTMTYIGNFDSNRCTTTRTVGMTAADFSVDGSLIIAKNQEEGFIWERLPGQTFDEVLQAHYDSPGYIAFAPNTGGQFNCPAWARRYASMLRITVFIQ